jgi:hypothetical protein
LLSLLLQATAPLLSQHHRTVPFNTPSQAVDFETPLFKGKMIAMFANVANTPAGVFDGKRRLMWMAVQVRVVCCATAKLLSF